jgi:hypothetical protein
MAVVATLACRRTWPTSASEDPAASIWVARLWRSRCAPARGTPDRSQALYTAQVTARGVTAPMGAVARKNTALVCTLGRQRR